MLAKQNIMIEYVYQLLILFWYVIEMIELVLVCQLLNLGKSLPEGEDQSLFKVQAFCVSFWEV
jgi:hypothetical protein